MSPRKTRKKKKKKDLFTITKHNVLVGFDNIPITEKTVYSTDQFGKRQVIDIDKFLIRAHIDSQGEATDYKSNPEKYKYASEEYKRRLLLQLKKDNSSRRLFQKKTKKKYSSKTIKSQIDKMPIKKIQKIYYTLLHKKKGKSGKK
jgi:hypothetical protein